MKTDILSIFPRKARSSASYILDYFIAFLPCLVFSSVFYSSGIFLNLLITAITALVCETALCLILKKEADLTHTVRALIIILCLPVKLPVWIPVLCGVVIFALSTVRGLISKYVTFEVVSAVLIPVFMLLTNAKTPSAHPSDTVLRGEMLEDTSVLELILGTKSEAFAGGCLICLLFAFVFLALRKRIPYIGGALFYVSLIAVLGFLYTEGNITPIYYVSFFALDPKIVFASLFLVTLGGTLPGNKKVGYVLSVLGGALLGLVTVKLGIMNGIYYVILIMSLISRPTELLLHNIRHNKKKAK